MATRHDHQAIIDRLQRNSPGEEWLCELANLFKVFGDSTRMRIMYALLEEEMCVCAISEFLGMTQSAVSHQLKVLKDHQLVRGRRVGKMMYYALADAHVHAILSQGYEHITEGKES